MDTQKVDEVVGRCESAKQATDESIARLEEASTRALADSEQARQSLVRSAEDIRGQASAIVDRASEAAHESTQQLDQILVTLERAESWDLAVQERCDELDERVGERVRITMQEQSLAMAEQISILDDRLERAESRETVLRKVVEAQTKDIAALRDMVAALTITQKQDDEREPLIPVVRKATPRKKAAAKKTTKKVSTKKTTARKAVSNKPATKKATRTKKPAAKQTAAKPTPCTI